MQSLFDLVATPQIVTDGVPKAPSRGRVAATKNSDETVGS